MDMWKQVSHPGSDLPNWLLAVPQNANTVAEANILISALPCLKPHLCERSGPKQRPFVLEHELSLQKKSTDTEIRASIYKFSKENLHTWSIVSMWA